MTSASLVFKNFKQEFTKAVNQLSRISGIAVPPEVNPSLAFPLVKSFFFTYPEVHARCLARCPSRADMLEFFEWVNQDMPQIDEAQFEDMKPVFYHIAKTIPPVPNV